MYLRKKGKEAMFCFSHDAAANNNNNFFLYQNKKNGNKAQYDGHGTWHSLEDLHVYACKISRFV